MNVMSMLCAYLPILSAIIAAAPSLRVEAGHPGNQIEGLTVEGLSAGTLTLRASKATNARIVLRSDAPLLLRSASGASASLRPGWDGTLGYSLYGLELTITSPGSVIIQLEQVPQPTTTQVSSDEDNKAFTAALARRPSRCPDTSDGFNAWQRDYRERLTKWLMGGSQPQRVAPQARVVQTWDYPRFTLRKVEYRSQKDRGNTLLLSLPKGMSKAPLLLALHGHEAAWGEADANAYRAGHADDFIAYFAERGWAVVQPATMNHTLQHANWTLQGEWTWDAMAAIDYALSLPDIDSQCVTVCGLSTGGHLAMNVLALDDRVKAGVVGGVLSTWNHYARRMRIPPGCDCGIHALLGPGLEQCDWAALAAPKRVQFQHGRADGAMCPGADPATLDLKWFEGVMPKAEFDAAFAEVRRAYTLAGSPDTVSLFLHKAGHRIDNEAAYEWLSRPIRP